MPALVKDLTKEQVAYMIDEGRKIKEVEWKFSASLDFTDEDVDEMRKHIRKIAAVKLGLPSEVLDSYDPEILLDRSIFLDYQEKGGKEIVDLGFRCAEAMLWYPSKEDGTGIPLFKIFKEDNHVRPYYLASLERLRESYSFARKVPEEEILGFLDRCRNPLLKFTSLLDKL